MPRGTTLIEVLAGLVVLGTLLASVAVARGRFMRQWAEADRRTRAAQAADALLAGWLAGPQSNVPAPAAGTLKNSPALSWQTRIMPDVVAGRLGAVKVRLEIFDRTGGWRADRADATPVLAVEFLMHKPPRPPIPSSAPPRDSRMQLR